MFVLRTTICYSLVAWLIGNAIEPMVRAADLDSRSAHRVALPTSDTLRLQSVSPNGELKAESGTSPTTVQVSIGRDDMTGLWIVASNPYPWPVLVEVVVKANEPGITMLASVSERRSATAKRDDSTTVTVPWQFVLDGSSQAAWRFADETFEISRWSHRIESRALTELESRLTRLTAALSQLTSFQTIDGFLADGDFELEGDALPDHWNASMIPTSRWKLTTEAARNGECSMVFECGRVGQRGWLQSPNVPIPADGRIAATAWLKLDPDSPTPTIVASTTLVDTDEQLSEWKQTYNAGELARKSDGWQRIDFPGLTPASWVGRTSTNATKHFVRFTLDVEGATKLWIDDFTAGRVLLDEDERRELRSSLYVARRELSQNHPQAAWELTQSDVFRYVVETAPQVAPKATVAPEVRTAEGLLRNRSEPRKPLFDGSRRRVR